VDFASQIKQIEEQAAALRAAAVAAGPAAPVPTCPEWTVEQLVAHIGRVHGWAVRALGSDPDAGPPRRPDTPGSWDALLSWWDDTVATLATDLRATGPDGPAWVFDRSVPSTAAFWARRQAHETAIHRLDAEHAHVGTDEPSAVPSLVFDSVLAADGIAEVLEVLVPRRLAREPSAAEGTVLFHAADAGRAWRVRFVPGAAPEVGPADDIAADASVVGTADAVYRAAWHRPSTAVVTGDRALVEALNTP
jgi:uncharacterized protein (TIGR03083 family)